MARVNPALRARIEPDSTHMLAAAFIAIGGFFAQFCSAPDFPNAERGTVCVLHPDLRTSAHCFSALINEMDCLGGTGEDYTLTAGTVDPPLLGFWRRQSRIDFGK